MCHQLGDLADSARLAVFESQKWILLYSQHVELAQHCTLAGTRCCGQLVTRSFNSQYINTWLKSISRAELNGRTYAGNSLTLSDRAIVA
jgi:hypothetical protein